MNASFFDKLDIILNKIAYLNLFKYIDRILLNKKINNKEKTK